MADRDLNDAETIALERIERLFELAERVFGEHPERADRYVELAWRIATRHNVRIPKSMRTKFCRRCKSFFGPDRYRVRLRAKPTTRLVITCLRCGYTRTFPHGKGKIEPKAK